MRGSVTYIVIASNKLVQYICIYIICVYDKIVAFSRQKAILKLVRPYDNRGPFCLQRLSSDDKSLLKQGKIHTEPKL